MAFVKELRRLEEACTILESLCLYNFTGRNEEFEEKLRSFALEFSNVWEIPAKEVEELRGGASAQVFCRAYPPVADPKIDDSRLRFWEQEASRLASEVREDSFYQKLREAYRDDNQTEIKDLVSSVWDDVKPISTIKGRDWARTCKENFYHGVMPVRDCEKATQTFDKELISPAEYVDRCLRIMSEGLRPGRGLRSMPMDEVIRPIYITPQIETAEVYGPLFFEIKPQDKGYTIWTINEILSTASEDIGVYTPRLSLPMKLKLSKNASFGAHNEETRKAYIRDVRRELKRRGIKDEN